MTRLWVLKTGRKIPALDAIPGDYEHWIATGMGLREDEFETIAIVDGAPLPPPEHISALAITGSGAMVTDGEPWVEACAQWLRQLIARDTPVLGICFGHQLLAHALGGTVGDNPAGVEVGTVALTLNHSGLADPLLGALPTHCAAQASHRQSVLTLPPEARLLAASAMDPHHAFAYGQRAWGLQFHPEFDHRIIAAFIENYRPALESEGREVAKLLAQRRPTAHSAGVLRRFLRLAETAH